MTDTLRRREPPEFDPLPEWAGPSTRLVHAGRRRERNAGAVVPPIYQTSTFHYPAEFSDADPPGGSYLYTRHGNPTQEVAAEAVRSLEGAETARVFASGMGALSAALLGLVRAGDTVVLLESLYGGSLDLASNVLPRFGVRVRWVPDEDRNRPEGHVPKGTRLVLLESPTNPLLRVVDLAAWGRAADAAGALLVVDNTFATPVNQRPLALGADLVVHSASKFFGGHSDLIAGALAGSHRLVERIEATATVLGAPLDPFAAFLLARGARTLALRVGRHNENGRRVVEALSGRPEVLSLHYPGYGDRVEEEIAQRQMSGRGGVLALSLRGGRAAAHRFLHRLRLVHVAPSLGGVESLASLPSETSHVGLTEAERSRRGIDEGLVRISLGIEDPDDLVRDLTEALGSA
ncbi:MAG TPA: aminotransferase class I/II-fold pyridoxal phosphate-dependent enzyme [Thermoplasmata archaeon]|nr:aminotransferase class I/II-fold pyridoxal phosphate-dependent enzyme [Thermoplasmata archaeon]